MTILYENKRLLTGAKAPRFVMSGDDETAYDVMGLYPGRHPNAMYIDHAVADLVRTIGEKGWSIPGIDISFAVTEDDDHPTHRVSYLAGGTGTDRWEIHFDRPEYWDGRNHIPSKASRIIIPKYDIRLRHDGTSDCFPYIGNDWENDADDFYYAQKPGDKNTRTKPLFSHYACEHSNYFPVTGSMRETRGRPNAFTKPRVHKTFSDFLNGVTETLSAVPNHELGPYATWAEKARITKINAPMLTTPTLYVTRRELGNWDGSNIELPTDGLPLYPYEPFSIDFPAVVNEPVQYAFAGQPNFGRLDVCDTEPTDPSARIFEVNLHYLNDIYVFNQSGADMLRENLLQVARREKRLELNSSEKISVQRMAAESVIPLADFKGNFTDDTVFMIARPLWGDEVDDVTDRVRTLIDQQNGQKRYALKPLGPA